jgi:hypothetical protein
MKIDFSTVIKDLNGDAVKDGRKTDFYHSASSTSDGETITTYDHPLA